MPKKKGIYVDLPKLLYRDTIDKLLLGYVLGFRNRNVLQVLEVREACKQFMEDFNLGEDDYPLDTAISTFYRLFKEYITLRHQRNDSNCNTKRNPG